MVKKQEGSIFSKLKRKIKGTSIAEDPRPDYEIAAQWYERKYGKSWDDLSLRVRLDYIRMIREQRNVANSPTSLRPLLALVIGVTIFGIIGWFCLKYAMDMMTIEDGNYPVPKPMIQCWGFILMLFGPLGGGILGVYCFNLINNPREFVSRVKRLGRDLMEGKWMVIVFVGGVILVPFIIWWFCVDMTPWMIFIAPLMILSLIVGKRRR